MNNINPVPKRQADRTQMILLYFVLTAGLATGLAIYSSASTLIAIVRTSSAVLFLPLLLSLVLAFLLEPIVSFFERKTANRILSIFIVYVLFAIVIYLLMALIIPHWQGAWNSLQADLPRYIRGMTSYIREFGLKVEEQAPFIDTAGLVERGRSFGKEIINAVIVNTPQSALRIGGLFLIVPLFTFFFLRDGSRILRSCISLAPNRTFEMVHDLSYLITRQLSHFIRGRIIEATIIGIVIFVGLSFTDIRYAGFLAIFAGITNLIPYIGPLIGMVPGILIALVDLGVGGQFWWIVIVYFIIAQVVVDNFILIPILISRYSNLHPLWVIIAIVIGGKLYGIIGMVIGVPIASTIKICFVEIRQYRRTFSLTDNFQEPDS